MFLIIHASIISDSERIRREGHYGKFPVGWGRGTGDGVR